MTTPHDEKKRHTTWYQHNDPISGGYKIVYRLKGVDKISEPVIQTCNDSVNMDFGSVRGRGRKPNEDMIRSAATGYAPAIRADIRRS